MRKARNLCGFFWSRKSWENCKDNVRGADKRQSEADTTAEMAEDSSRMSWPSARLLTQVSTFLQ